MENQPLATQCEPHSTDTEKSSKGSLIEQWVVRFALNAGQVLDARAIAIYVSLWMEAFSDVSVPVLRQAFIRTLRTAKFWPIKVADILEHITRAEESANAEAAEMAWQQVLNLYRTCYNPDIPQYLYRALSKLPEQARRAAQAAGVFREHESPDSLHVWCKRRFIEFFLAWSERKQNEFLLPPGEMRDLIEKSAQKLLPDSPNKKQ
jgi:hypothetical protein